MNTMNTIVLFRTIVVRIMTLKEKPVNAKSTVQVQSDDDD